MRLGEDKRRGLFSAALVGVLCAAGAASAEPGENAPEAQAKKAEPPPRPPPLGAGEPPSPPPWRRSVDVGIDVAFVARPASPIVDGKPSSIGYDPAVGYGVHGRVEILRYLWFTGYFVSSAHEVELPRGSLNQDDAELSIDSVATFSLGARLLPTWPLTDRLRTWVSVGIGWGRLEFGRMDVTEAGKTFVVRDRAESFIDIPIGVGTSFTIVPRWLSLDIEGTYSFIVGQRGTSVEPAQAVNAAGKITSIGGFPTLDGSFVQTVGLSLLL